MDTLAGSGPTRKQITFWITIQPMHVGRMLSEVPIGANFYVNVTEDSCLKCNSEVSPLSVSPTR